ncbi:uncharacterized protein LOC113851403 [Abrus precatorius]|uniref:Uncharacterized protein LOC113851403 n=1 Tax=Abrus precatorius TaxID=3816 RepID=A0A8B8K1S7_ABRPR|nr:uncharacterized protein LOC113851403 [Abrus precatorius]
MEQHLTNPRIQAHKEEEQVHESDNVVGSFPSSCSSSSSLSGISSGSSLESDSFEEVTSPASSSSSSDPLSDMSSLFQQLPIKRGLSKFYQGKSQSFTSLTNVRSLEDLAKPENPYNKRLKSCKSYGGGLSEKHRTKCNNPKSISKRGTMNSPTSRGSCSSLRRPPIPPHRSNSTIPSQTVLFA